MAPIHEVGTWRCDCTLFPRARRSQLRMTLRIDKVPAGAGTTIRLIGRMRAGLIEELKMQIRESGTPVVLDLDEVSLVDVDVVRFLGECQAEGIALIHCSPYINDWIAMERGRKSGDISDSDN
jgi:hypothetical protein